MAFNRYHDNLLYFATKVVNNYLKILRVIRYFRKFMTVLAVKSLKTTVQLQQYL